MSEMRAQLTLRVRAQLDKLRKYRSGLSEIQREARSMRKGLGSASDGTRRLAREQRDGAEAARRAATGHQQLIEKFRRQKGAAQRLNIELDDTQNELKMLAREGKTTGREFDQLRTRASRLKGRLGDQNRELENSRRALKSAGIETRKLSSAQTAIRSDISRATAEINQQEDALRRLASREAAVARVQSRARDRRNAGLMRGGATMAGGAGAMYVGARATRAALMPGMSYGNFDAQADAVAAIARVQAGSEQDLMLRSNARQLGASTSFSAMEAGQGQEFLAMAGFDPQAIVGSMESVLQLAKAGRVELGLAADIASDIGSGFGIERTPDGMKRLSDVLVATTTRANTNVEMLGETMGYAAPAAKKLGVSLETTSAMAGVLADNKIKGSRAGTALNAIFSRLAGGSKPVKDALDSIGLSVKDADGNMRPILDILGELKDKTSDLGNAEQLEILNDLAGMEAGGALATLIDDVGFDRINELVAELQNAKGEAARVSTEMGDNLPGDIKSAKSALAELGLVVGEEVAPILRDLIQGTTEVVRSITDWAKAHPNLVKALGLGAIAIAGLATAAGALAVVLGGAMMTMATFRFAATMMGLRARGAGGGVTGLMSSLLGLQRTRPVNLRNKIRPMRSWRGLIPKIRWRSLAGKLSWRSLIVPLKWGSRMIPGIGWALLAGTLAWDLLLKDMLPWGDYIQAPDWGFLLGLNGRLDWSDLVRAITWRPAWFPAIDWAAVLGPNGRLDWGDLIDVLTWRREWFIAPDWSAMLGENGQLDWGDLIDVITWKPAWFPTIDWRGLMGEASALDWGMLVDVLTWKPAWFPSIDWAGLTGSWSKFDLSSMVDKITSWDLPEFSWPDLPAFPALSFSWKSVLPSFAWGDIVPDFDLPNPIRGWFGGKPDQPEAPRDAVSSDTARPKRKPDRPTRTIDVAPPPVLPTAGDVAAVTEAVGAARTAVDALPQAVRSAVTKAEGTLASVSWVHHGQRMMETLAQGVRNSGHLVAAAVQAELAEARALLPSSNAKRGPLSNLTGNGFAILGTMAQGVRRSGAPLMQAISGEVATLPPIMPKLALAGGLEPSGGAAQRGGPGPAPSQGGMTVQGGIHIRIDGSGDPEATARAVQRHLERLMHRRMSD